MLAGEAWGGSPAFLFGTCGHGGLSAEKKLALRFLKRGGRRHGPVREATGQRPGGVEKMICRSVLTVGIRRVCLEFRDRLQ
jgi:hypothetical protein